MHAFRPLSRHQTVAERKRAVAVDVVLAPFRVSWNLDQNVAAIEASLDECVEGDLVACPEGALSGYSDELEALATLQPERLEAALAHIEGRVRARHLTVALGRLWPEGGRWSNRAVVLAPDDSRWWYAKVNLATHERGVLVFGQSLTVRSGPPTAWASNCVGTSSFPNSGGGSPSRERRCSCTSPMPWAIPRTIRCGRVSW